MDDFAWPPDYVSIYMERQKRLNLMRSAPLFKSSAMHYYSTHPIEFIEHWCDTYDPRNGKHNGRQKRMPFVLFPKQKELIEFLEWCMKHQRSGLIEKSRDMGATWVCGAYCVWLWLFYPDTAMSWGSRKAMYVDELGDMKSIFEKIRMIIRMLPAEFTPQGFKQDKNLTYMRLTNPENGSIIAGEAGDGMGRGGRSSIYFKDESAHYERPEKIEAAVGDNTNVEIDLSSVNGLGNVFYRKREAGNDWQGPNHKYPEHGVMVFILDWRDHPDKTQAWYNTRRRSAQEKGTLHLFAQEVDRNYASSVQNALMRIEWIQAAIDADKKLGFDDDGPFMAGLDVADGGGDTNAYSFRKGVCLKGLAEWGSESVDDTGQTARKAAGLALTAAGPIEVQYDAVGVGGGVKGETNRLKQDGKLPKRVKFIAWRGSAKVLNPSQRIIEGDSTEARESPKNKDFYKNLKAQAWWELRNRFYRTWQAVHDGVEHDPSTLISIPSDLPLLRKLEKELCQVTTVRDSSMRIMVDKAPEGTKSPNVADSVVMCYHPVEDVSPDSLIGNPW